jgi:4-hydroxythreonine-4-phosphate dehydrogenase
MKRHSKPVLAITMGDAAGTGPEIITRALVEPEVTAYCHPVVIGDAATMQAALEITGATTQVRVIERLEDASFAKNSIEVLDQHNIQLDRLMRGKIDTMAGRAAFDYIKLAATLALSREVDAIVTSAISKEALNKAGYHYSGHTDLLAELCQAPNVAMMLTSGNLRVVHVNTHLSLLQAIETITQKRIVKVIHLTVNALRRLSIDEPRIAVAGLNPHAGEGGLFGDEEIKKIAPAVNEARQKGINIIGPLPPDSVFFRTSQGEFDAAIAMYHDQGHIAVKMLGIEVGVNVTLGLPIIRTSVEHGTAFDKAGKGTASPKSLILAIKLASTMSR